MAELRFCCERFARQATALQAGAGVGYPGMLPDAQFERLEREGGWGINGCCGGGCFVVVGMKFCPYCGANLDLMPIHGRLFTAEELQNLPDEEVADKVIV